MAYWISDEFPEADMNKVIKMCLIHDLGECFTGDIPTFDKTKADEQEEKNERAGFDESTPHCRTVKGYPASL